MEMKKEASDGRGAQVAPRRQGRILRRGVLALEPRLAEGEGDVLVLDHVADLLAHGHDEQGEEVEDEHGPEDRDVEDAEEGHAEGDEHPSGEGMPELELGQLADEGLELVRLGRGEHPFYSWVGNG
eukprot:CAMPEP_0113690632 /NCGR_PEP_ID=MMETSP0038_2-20120614/17913_1 /TAXON_ID=2898 /ORGANISM="Cryptomonas paramecium" /LENGTH=125 /DNA_ID=CAMNT_0000612007 /DNA_START=72 /DNA_END=453 /DNA_ORIENTATION=- /assembly_acc=CAM_ASM_000170